MRATSCPGGLRAIGALVALIVTGGPPGGASEPEWADSPEAYFLTRSERRDWTRLKDDDSREAFRKRYWAIRDPSPRTGRNEFRELVALRMAEADRRFSVPALPGSRTARGRVYVVLGPPAVQKETVGPLDTRPEFGAGNKPFIRRMSLDGGSWHVWVYDRETTPDIADAVGRPFLEIPFVVVPGVRDEIQDRGTFENAREAVARRSIVNP